MREGIIIAVALPMSKILLLEDDPEYRGIIERVLSRNCPCTVTSVATEMQAWEELSKEDFDLVLLDLNIDGRRCWETLKRVVSHPAKPIAIALSCEDTRENADYAVSLGAYAFLSKPINFIRLEMTIESALRE
jgi:DNA-binding NtrC family response regulator